MLRTAIILLFFSLLLPSCLKKQERDLFNAYIGPQPTNYDWHKTQEIIAIGVIYNLMDGLFSYDLSTAQMKVIPKIVKSYRHENNFKNWTFHIKENIRWSDGVKLTAQDFVNAWQRILTQKTTSPHANRFFIIKGAQDFYLQKKSFSQVSIKSLDTFTLAIELNQPKENFPSFLTGFYSFPIRKDLLDPAGNFTTQSLNTTVGPYSLEESSINKDQTCMKNNPYYEKIPVQKRICFFWLDSKTTALQLFQKGQLDFIKSPDSIDVTTRKLTQHFRSSETHGLYYLAFNFNKYPGKDIQFRRAIKKLINRNEIEKLSELDFTVTDSIYPRSLIDSQTIKSTDETVLKALHLKSPIRLASNNTPFHTKILTYLARQFEIKLNQKINIEMTESKSYFYQLKNENKFDLFRVSWTPTEVSPQAYAELFTSDSPMNFSSYKNENYDLLVKKAIAAGESEKAISLYKEINNVIVHKDIVAIPLFNHKQSFLIRNEKFDLFPHPTERVDFIYLEKKDL